MGKNILGIDVGTTTCKMGVVTADFEAQTLETRGEIQSSRYPENMIRQGGVNIQLLVATVRQAIQSFLDKSDIDQIHRVSMIGFGPTFAPCDLQNQEIIPARGGRMYNYQNDKLQPSITTLQHLEPILGQKLGAHHALVQLQAQYLDQGEKLLEQGSKLSGFVINSVLGVLAQELCPEAAGKLSRGEASYMGLVTPGSGRWVHQLTQIVEAEVLPELRRADQSLGRIRGNDLHPSLRNASLHIGGTDGPMIQQYGPHHAAEGTSLGIGTTMAVRVSGEHPLKDPNLWNIRFREGEITSGRASNTGASTLDHYFPEKHGEDVDEDVRNFWKDPAKFENFLSNYPLVEMPGHAGSRDGKLTPEQGGLYSIEAQEQVPLSPDFPDERLAFLASEGIVFRALQLVGELKSAKEAAGEDFGNEFHIAGGLMNSPVMRDMILSFLEHFLDIKDPQLLESSYECSGIIACAKSVYRKTLQWKDPEPNRIGLKDRTFVLTSKMLAQFQRRWEGFKAIDAKLRAEV